MPHKIEIDFDTAEISVIVDGVTQERQPFASNEGFQTLSDAWLRVGWDAKYVYGFSSMGRPVIQLPDDMIRMQECL